MLVLFAAVVRKGRFVAVQESAPFSYQPGKPVYGVRLFPDGWERNGYLPSEQYLLGDQFPRGGEFLPGDAIPGTELSTFQQMWSRIGASSSSFERAGGVSLRGRDTLVLVVLPADPRERAEARIRPLFIVGQNVFGS